MPIPCQGFTFTWNGTALPEVRSLQLERQVDPNSTYFSRGGTVPPWALTGSLRIVSLAPSLLTEAQFGRVGNLVITVPYGSTAMTIFSGRALYMGMSATANPNEAVVLAHTFKVSSATKALSTT